MAFTTYATLQTAIAAWLHRTDLTTNIPDFITLAEAQMQRNLNVAEQETTTTLTASAGATSVTLPTDYNKMRRIRYLYGNTYIDLWPVALSPSYSDGTTASPIRVISMQGSTIAFHNPTDQQYSLVIDYYAKFTPLSNSNTTNWILTSHPDAYLYGALMQSAPFLGTDNRLALWETAFTTAIDEINQEDFAKRHSQLQMTSDVAWANRNGYDRRLWQ